MHPGGGVLTAPVAPNVRSPWVISSGAQLVNVMDLAIGNGLRTDDQQEKLLALAEFMNRDSLPFVDYVAEVAASWSASPCRRCDLPAEAGERLCDECHPHRDAFAAEERADHLMDLVQR